MSFNWHFGDIYYISKFCKFCSLFWYQNDVCTQKHVEAYVHLKVACVVATILRKSSWKFLASCCSYLFFADWGSFPRIVRTRLDGSERINFVPSLRPAVKVSSGPTVDTRPIKKPYGLAVDYEENMLYWCDKTLNLIERVNITSMEREVIISANLTDCVSVDVYGDYVYWADL